LAAPQNRFDQSSQTHRKTVVEAAYSIILTTVKLVSPRSNLFDHSQTGFTTVELV
jgi:hypothetical protein